MLAEMMYGFHTNSLGGSEHVPCLFASFTQNALLAGLISDGFHALFDCFALGISLVAMALTEVHA
jgi:hypothetical protein